MGVFNRNKEDDSSCTILAKNMRLLTGLIIASLLVAAASTQEQCRIDCNSSPRPVGPTRPWDLNLSKPYPHHVAAQVDEEGKYAFVEFCNLGCNYFYVSSGAGEDGDSDSNAATLDRCMTQCDTNFRYNITVGYNDLIEIARLECRDGCQMALKRCQPGYYCEQVEFSAKNDFALGLSNKQLNGGQMIPCPPGTYRQNTVVTQCVECPPNYYREDFKGKSLLDCTKCPSGTSSKRGSTSIKDCVRCPAGKFSIEGGFCECITPMACDVNQLPDPADAEKKDAVPYIGRW